MSASKAKSRKRTPTDAAASIPGAAGHAPALNDEQLRVLHQVYGIILAHTKSGAAA
jgi:hypothetical protein